MKRIKRINSERSPIRVLALVLPVLAGACFAWAGAPVGSEPPQADPKIRIGAANLSPIDGSGIRARIRFVDDGTKLQVTGKASGLDPAESYVTLIYDNGSSPNGPTACQPSIFDPKDPDFLLNTMFVGFWEVDKKGNGRLKAINTNGGLDFVPLNKFRNTSVRLVVGPPPDEGGIPMTELMACGAVVTPRLGDIDGDLSIGARDMVEVIRAWGACDGCPADLDGNGVVDAQDLLVVTANWS